MDRILIVDSSVQNTDLMRECLTNQNTEIMTSESGLNALAKIDLFKPDLIILDANLTDISGYDVCKKVKERTETQFIIVLIVSISETKEGRVRAIEVGADDYMEKTFDATLIKSKIKSLLRLKYLGDQLKQKLIELEEKNNILEFQLKMARHVQMSLIPKIDMDFNGVTMYSKYMPAMDIGGDFYDVFEINDTNVGVIMGDVSGHGIAAALLTSMLNVICRNLAFKTSLPDEFLYSLNNEFCRVFERGTNDMYACVFYIIINTEKKEIMYANAGQALPVFVDSQTGHATELEASGLPVGLIKNSKYEYSTMSYHKEDMLLLHTDGLSDTFYKESPDEFSVRLKEIMADSCSLKNPQEIIDVVLGSFYSFNSSENEKLELDDVSILLCKM